MNTLNSIFDWMIGAGLRASVLVLVVLTAQWLFKTRLPSRWRYAVWLPVLAALLVPALPLLPSWMKWSAVKAVPAQTDTTTAVATESAPAPAMAPVQLGEFAAVPPSIDKGAVVPAVQAGVAPAAKPMDWRSWLVAVWCCGAVGAGLFVLASFAWSLRRIRRTACVVEGELLARIVRTARAVGLRKAPRVLQSPDVASPAVCGLWRPTLLLNAGFPVALSEDEADMVLRHELTHIRRGDLALNALLCALLALHWWNPLLWLAFARVRADREAACDADVLRDEPAPRRATYGHTLLKLETVGAPSGLCLGFVGILQRGGALRERIQNIISQPTISKTMKTTLTLSILTIAVLGLAKAAEPESKDREKKAAEALPARLLSHPEATPEAADAGAESKRLGLNLDKVTEIIVDIKLRSDNGPLAENLNLPAHARAGVIQLLKTAKPRASGIDWQILGRLRLKTEEGTTTIELFKGSKDQLILNASGEFGCKEGSLGEFLKLIDAAQIKLTSAENSAQTEDVAFFEKKYATKIEGVKPIGEYSDPDTFYSEIGKQLGIGKLALKAMEEKFDWKEDPGVKMAAKVNRAPGEWQVMVSRISISPTTGKPDPATIKVKLVLMDDGGKVSFMDDPAAPLPPTPPEAPTAEEPTEDVAFFEKKYATKIKSVKPMGEYDDPDKFFAEIGKQLGIGNLALDAVAEMFGWKKEEGKIMIAAKVNRAPGQWQVMVSRISISEKTGKPDPATVEVKLVLIDDEKKISFMDDPAAGKASGHGASGKGANAAPDAHQHLSLADLKGGEYAFSITQVAKHPTVGSPRDLIPDDAFVKADQAPNFSVKFSDDLKEVKITGHNAVGVLDVEVKNVRIYRLTDGPKGKYGIATDLLLTQTDKGLVAQLTHFGSGVPVIESYRGTLERK